MKKLVATLMVGILFTSHAISTNAATETKYVGKIITSQGFTQETTVRPQTSISAMSAATSSKPTLSYKANISVTAAAVSRVTLSLSSIAKNQRTGRAVSIDKMKNV